jgi:uncharacterized protein (DUF2236 family)
MHHLISQRVNAERIVVLGWPRAILLQFAHPLVAAGVADHSTFRTGRFAAVYRLHQTIRAMLALGFGTERERQAALDGILAIHRRVHGTLRDTTGVFPAGTAYSAEDPELVLWVHATLLETVPLTYELLVRPLTADERDAYCEQTAPVAIDLGARPADVPRTWSAMLDYLDRMHRSGAIAVGADALKLADRVLSPLGAAGAPFAWMNRTLTIGLLPAHIREQYGFAWSAAQARAFARISRTLRTARRLVPRALALWPEARCADPVEPG